MRGRSTSSAIVRAIGTGNQVGSYEIEAIDFDAIVDRFFFDTDFLMGPVLLA
ncbi:MAG: hypothetical protein HYY95_02415, partial [Candidatus Rokubacteria bacterium]|nr:hypothetical protein [Candidatus Rokubacteria bacterium]